MRLLLHRFAVWLERATRVGAGLPLEACGRLDPHGPHRHSPVASKCCPGVLGAPVDT